MNEEKNYFPWLKKDYQKKRDLLCNILKNVNLNPVVPQGSYFVLADIEKVNKNVYVTDPNGRLDYQFCRWLAKEIGKK